MRTTAGSTGLDVLDHSRSTATAKSGGGDLYHLIAELHMLTSVVDVPLHKNLGLEYFSWIPATPGSRMCSYSMRDGR